LGRVFGHEVSKPFFAFQPARASPFTWSPWAADLEADVKNVNGRDRDCLLTGWYKHTFDFSGDNALGLTGGLVDATDYLDENAWLFYF